MSCWLLTKIWLFEIFLKIFSCLKSSFQSLSQNKIQIISSFLLCGMRGIDDSILLNELLGFPLVDLNLAWDMDDKNKNFFSSRTTCKMKESELIKSTIQLPGLSDAYFSRSDFFKVWAQIFRTRGILPIAWNFFCFLYFRIWCHPIDMTTTRMMVSRNWWDHSWFSKKKKIWKSSSLNSADHQWSIWSHEQNFRILLFLNHLGYERGRSHLINDSTCLVLWWLFLEI